MVSSSHRHACTKGRERDRQQCQKKSEGTKASSGNTTFILTTLRLCGSITRSVPHSSSFSSGRNCVCICPTAIIMNLCCDKKTYLGIGCKTRFVAYCQRSTALSYICVVRCGSDAFSCSKWVILNRLNKKITATEITEIQQDEIIKQELSQYTFPENSKSVRIRF